MLIIWLLVFCLSIALLVKSADWFVESAEKIGLALKISPFIIGVTIVAIGTSFPEAASSLVAAFKGVTEVVAANVIGSNIFNILAIVGISAVIARTLIVKRSLIDLDAPLLTAATVLIIFIAWDKQIVFGEGILLICAFLVFLLYTIFQRRKNEPEKKYSKLNFKVFFILVLGLIGLIVGANYTIDSLVKISDILKISPALVSIIALAAGTSLPELVVSMRAAMQKKYEIALGNIFGSNVFNILFVTGLPALIKTLTVDDLTFSIGLPFLAAATLLFVISGISRRIHIWEGAMYLLIYTLFIAKLCGIF
ncbi:MAG: calcium/sodium antiporter [Candidatus Nealsonbacteria bacterium]